MKLLAPAFLGGIFIFIPSAMCQSNTVQPQQVHVTIEMPGGNGSRVMFAASRMERNLSNKATESVMHFKGNVEAKIISFAPGAPDRANSGVDLYLRADEVDYNEQTGKIRPHGNVSIAPYRETPQPITSK